MRGEGSMKTKKREQMNANHIIFKRMEELT